MDRRIDHRSNIIGLCILVDLDFLAQWSLSLYRLYPENLAVVMMVITMSAVTGLLTPSRHHEDDVDDLKSVFSSREKRFYAVGLGREVGE